MKIVIPSHRTESSLFHLRDVMSVSAKKPAPEQSTLESLLPVSLEEEDMKDFRLHFHPRRPMRAPQKYIECATYMAQLSAYINAIYMGLRFGLENYSYFTDAGRDVGAEISNIIAQHYANAADIEGTVKKYIHAMSQGGHHIIRDSKVYKGGKDVLYVGLRGVSKSPLLNVHSSEDYMLPWYTESGRWTDKFGEEAANKKINKAFVDTGWAIQNLLFDERAQALKGAYSRVDVQHAINTKFVDQLQKVFTSGPLAKARIAVALPTFQGTISPAAIEFLMKYNQILVVREPNYSIVTKKVNALNGAEEGKKVPDESLNIALEAQALQPEIGFSFAVNVPQHFCEFITQTTEKKIPLAPLNTWAATWGFAMFRPPGVKTGAMTPARAPMYVIMPSKSSELVKKRKDLGLYTEPGRVNEDGMYIDGNGDVCYLPKQEELHEDNAKKYEAIVEEALQISFEAGTPLAAGQQGSTGKVFDLASDNYRGKIYSLKQQLGEFTGAMQTFNWDFNCVITVSASDPDRVVSTKLAGANKPDALNLARYMQQDFGQGMRDMFSKSTHGAKRELVDKTKFADLGYAVENCSVFLNTFRAYQALAIAKKVPTFAELVQKAATALNIKKLDDEEVKDFEINRFESGKSIYGATIKPDLTVEDNDVNVVGGQLMKVLLVTVDQAEAGAKSNLAAWCVKNNEDPMDHDRFFDGAHMPVGEFHRLYQFLGGQVFYQALKHILAVPRKELQEPLYTVHENEKKTVRFNDLVQQVMPLALMFGKYVPHEREKIYKQAEEIAENNRNPKFSEDQLNIAGSKEGAQLFPHQAESLSILKNHPKIAVLDISPGGGKTILGLADIAMLVADNLIKRPVVVCPNGLVSNWAADAIKFFEGRYNVIPITTETYAEWGDERLTELCLKAPRNTIIIVGNSFLSNRGQMQLVIGNNVERMSDSTEFIKKLEPDYLLIDESQRIRNANSGIHRAVKSINQISSIKYGRIGTGTLIQNVLSDVVGQAAIYNAQIFRTKDDFDSVNKKVISTIGNKPVIDYSEDAPAKIRRRFGEFATVLTYKRKEWAFMLPLPVETFISVPFQENADPEMGLAHKMFYDAVLKQTLEELKNDKMVKALLGGKGEGEDEEEGDDSNGNGAGNGKEATTEGRKITTAEGTKIDVQDEDDDSDNLDALEAALQPYLQRLERILTDPFGDEELLDVAKKFMPHATRDTFVTAKVAKVIERIKKHFEYVEWKKGMEIKSGDMVDYNGKSYIFRYEERVGQSTITSVTPPDEDANNWRAQVRGKILIFCRYTRSVDAIYRALPAEFKKQAVLFHGEVEGNKWDNLNKFKTDPKVNILIANEMGISEGHNLQMASRFIRVEAPWAPGELDQSAARIFRPEVGGKNERPTIFLDWIICDGTLEVCKMGRLISKMLKKTKFDEVDNPKYYKDLNPLNLPIIKMSLENIQALDRMSDLCMVAGEGDLTDIHAHSYIGQYQYLTSETASEFREMRKTKRAYMIDVEPTPMPDDAKIIEFTPWVPNMKVADRHDEGLLLLSEVMQDEEHDITMAFKKNAKSILGQFVRCEFGLGTITRVSTKRDGEISKVWVKLAQGGEVEGISATKVYLATKVTEKTKNKQNKNAPKITQKDKDRTAKNRDRLRKAVKEQEEKPKPKIVKPTATTRKPKAEVKESSLNVELYPVVYNEFLALEAITDEFPTTRLKKYGFTQFGNYAYVSVKTYNQFTAILDWLEAKFTLNSKTVKYLDLLHDSFQSGKGRKFNVELAPQGEFPLFYQQHHRLTVVKNKRRPELKLYPVILNGNLMLCVDIASNPVIRKYVGKGDKMGVAIPGTSPATGFREADGLDIAFFPKKGLLVQAVKEMRADGITITNFQELKEEVAALSVTNRK